MCETNDHLFRRGLMGQYVCINDDSKFTYLHEEVVDHVDDVQMSRKMLTENIDCPALQGLWQNGMVGVGATFLRDLPGLYDKNIILIVKLTI